ncbi:hypothetical protein [Nitrosomonas communis]|uniref:hypothetical protein n=1 Tax=Nitrosomonas communis TaxID=44574 RepID=UPI003D2DD170
MQIGNLDVNQAIKAAKARINAAINVKAHGYKHEKIVFHRKGNGSFPMITIGEYEIDYVDINSNIDNYNCDVVALFIPFDWIEVREVKVLPGSR